VTTSVAAALMKMPWKLAARMPAVPAAQEIVIEKVMVTWPKSPASMQLISPPAAVLLPARAPWKVRHGAVRLQGLALSPALETQVRWA